MTIHSEDDDEDEDDDDDSDGDGCSDGDRGDDRIDSKELDPHSNSTDRRSIRLSEVMEAEATNVVASEWSSAREPFPTGEGPQAQTEVCAQSHALVGNGSRAEDRSDAIASVATSNRDFVASSLSPLGSERNEEVVEPSESKSDNDDSSVLSLDLDSFLEALITDEEPFQATLSPLDVLKNILRSFDIYDLFLEEFTEEDLEKLAQSMEQSLERGSVSIRNINSLYHAFQNFHGYLYPAWMRPLMSWLGERCEQPAAPIAEGKSSEKKPSKKRGIGSYRCSFCGKPKIQIIDGIKIPHGTCPKEQATGTGDKFDDLENLPEGCTIINVQTHHDNDEGRKLTPVIRDGDDGDKKPAAKPRVSAAASRASRRRDGIVSDDGDKKPAAKPRVPAAASRASRRRDGIVSDDGDKKPAAKPRVPAAASRASRRRDGDVSDYSDKKPAVKSRAPADGSRVLRNPRASRGLARARDLGQCVPISTPSPTWKRKKLNRDGKPEQEEELRAPICREEPQPQQNVCDLFILVLVLIVLRMI